METDFKHFRVLTYSPSRHAWYADDNSSKPELCSKTEKSNQHFSGYSRKRDDKYTILSTEGMQTFKMGLPQYFLHCYALFNHWEI